MELKFDFSCSAGIGRSGTFCLVDCCLVLIDKEGENRVSVQEVLLELRKYRMGLIQTHDQLTFSYEAIIEGIKRMNNDVSVAQRSQTTRRTSPSPFASFSDFQRTGQSGDCDRQRSRRGVLASAVAATLYVNPNSRSSIARVAARLQPTNLRPERSHVVRCVRHQRRLIRLVRRRLRGRRGCEDAERAAALRCGLKFTTGSQRNVRFNNSFR